MPIGGSILVVLLNLPVLGTSIHVVLLNPTALVGNHFGRGVVVVAALVVVVVVVLWVVVADSITVWKFVLPKPRFLFSGFV